MMNENDNKNSGGIEPFTSGSGKNTTHENSACQGKNINIEPVNQEELSMLLSEPVGYSDIVKQIRKDTLSHNKTDQQQKNSNIPEYDLGKQMLAAHRKNTAAKRGAPGQKTPVPIKSIPSPVLEKSASWEMIKQPMPTDVQSEAIIREIVARDIARLCRCNRI